MVRREEELGIDDLVQRLHIAGEREAGDGVFEPLVNLQMEEVLCSIKHFSEIERLPSKLATDNSALAKAYCTSLHLYKIARKLVSQNPTDDMSEYFIALLYNALNTTRFATLPSRQREHAMLCASLLVDRLGLSS